MILRSEGRWRSGSQFQTFSKYAMTYIIENSDKIIAIVTAVVAVASAIAALTPTPNDDTFVGKAYKLVDWLALNIGKAKQ